MHTSRNDHRAALVLAAAAGAGLVAAIWGYTVFTGTAGTGGALLVVASSALILGAGLLLGLARDLPRWVHVTFDSLLLLGILCTALAGWLLLNWALVAAMIAALGAELYRLARRAAIGEPQTA